MTDNNNTPSYGFIPTQGFSSIVDDVPESHSKDALQWFCPPNSWKDDDVLDEAKRGWWKVVGSSASKGNSLSSSSLLLAPPAKRDFWRKTYYQPLLVKDDAPFLYRTIALEELPVTIECSFSIDAKSQFDQAGIMIRLDYEHWMKTGIEVVDGTPRLSCVVTNGFSDWSTQQVSSAEMKIRVHVLPQQGGSLVVEASPCDSNDWTFIRIAHLHKDMNHDMLNDATNVRNAFQGIGAKDGAIMVGIFGACPVDQNGMVVKFHDLSIIQGSSFVHDA